MKIRVVFIVMFLFLCNGVFGQNPLVKLSDKRFGGTGEDNFTCFQQTADGGYILGGESYSDSSGDKTQTNWGNYHFDYWIIKIDSLGNKQWDKGYGGTDDDYLVTEQQTKDGGYILGGSSYSPMGGDKSQDNWNQGSHTFDYWVVKIDSLGNKQWDKRYGGDDRDEFGELHQTSDGGYILGGWSQSNISGDKTQNLWDTSAINPPRDFWIVKIDSVGNKQWDKDFGGTGNDFLRSLQQTKDKGYILGGTSDSPVGGDKTQPTHGS